MKRAEKNRSIIVITAGALLALITVCFSALGMHIHALTAAEIRIPLRLDIVSERASKEVPPEFLEKTYTFVLERVTPGAPLPEGASGDRAYLEIKGCGSIELKGFSFSESGKYEYRLYQQPKQEDGLTCDSTVYDLVVTAASADDVSFYITEPDGEKPDSVEFINVVAESADEENEDDEKEDEPDKPDDDPPPIYVEFPADGLVKKINGSGEFSDTSFRFRAVPDAATCALGQDVTLEAEIKGEGSTRFGRIAVTKEGTYTYTIEEIADHRLSWKYDKTKYVCSFTVSRVTDGEGNARLEVTGTAVGKSGETVEAAFGAAAEGGTGDASGSAGSMADGSSGFVTFTNTPSAANKISSAVKTGDPEQLMLMVVMLVSAGLALTFILLPRRRSRYRHR